MRNYIMLVNGWPHYFTTLGEALWAFDGIVRPERRWDPITVRRNGANRQMVTSCRNGTVVRLFGYSVLDS